MTTPTTSNEQRTTNNEPVVAFAAIEKSFFGVKVLKGVSFSAGAASGGNYSLIGGFWGAVIPVQTPGAPTLLITPTGTNVTLSWLPNTPGFVLQQVSALTPVPIGWANAPAGYTNGVTIPAASQTRYFRLIKP